MFYGSEREIRSDISVLLLPFTGSRVIFGLSSKSFSQLYLWREKLFKIRKKELNIFPPFFVVQNQTKFFLYRNKIF